MASPTNKFDPRVTSSPNNNATLNKNVSQASSKLSRDSSNATQLLPPAQRNNLRIGSFNANSIKGKRAELAELADSTLMDVMIITETKLPSQKEVKELSKNPSSKENVYLSLKPSEVLPKNFDGSIHRPRSIHGGGVMIAVKNDLVAEEVSLNASKNGEIVCAKISIEKAPPLYIVAYYRPPNDTTTAMDALEQALEELQPRLDKNPRTCLIVAGDFNAPGIDWPQLAVKQEGPNKEMCNRLIDILATSQLKQLVEVPTRQKAILDLFCVNKPGLIKNVSVIPGISDHDGAVIVDTSLKATINKKPRRKIPLWSKANWQELKAKTVVFSNKYLDECTTRTVQENNNATMKYLKDTLENLPSKMSSSRYNLPWMTPDIKRMCRRKRRVYKKARNGSTDHRTLFTQLQNATRDALRKSHWNYVNDILQTTQETGNNKPFWSYIKSQKQDSTGVAPLRFEGNLCSDAEGKAKALSEQFSSVFTEDTPETANIKSEGPSYPPIPDLTIREEGIEKLLAGLNPSKASGPDEIPARLLKELAKELAPVVTSLFKQSISTGDVPEEWTSAWITPVFKKGSRSDPANYRPVSLTCILCKLMEHVLCTHIRGHLDRHGILAPENHGFRSNHSCETQLLLTSHDLLQQRDAGHQIDVTILDFSKAFDTVPHKRLLGKLDLSYMASPGRSISGYPTS